MVSEPTQPKTASVPPDVSEVPNGGWDPRGCGCSGMKTWWTRRR